MSLTVTHGNNLWFAIFATTVNSVWKICLHGLFPVHAPSKIDPVSWLAKLGTELERCTTEGKPHHEEKKMKKQYKFAELTKEEKEYHEMILLEEVDVQAWFAIAFSSIFDEELFVTVQ